MGGVDAPALLLDAHELTAPKQAICPRKAMARLAIDHAIDSDGRRIRRDFVGGGHASREGRAFRTGAEQLLGTPPTLLKELTTQAAARNATWLRGGSV